MIINRLLLCIAACCLSSPLATYGADSCVTTVCHTAIGAVKSPHQPVKDGDCSGCHRQKAKAHPVKGEKGFEPTIRGAALCSQCHDAKGKNKVVHQPIKDGECTACHKPHGAANRFLLDAGGDLTELCLGCHDAAPFKQKLRHGPAAVGNCTKCHDPHDAAEKALMKGPVREVCLKCHADFAKSLAASAAPHPPVKNGPCTACHDPHGSKIAALLKNEMPNLCTDCHDAIGKKMKTVKVLHKPLLQAGGCANCHAAHYAKAKGLLAADEMTTCLGCHDREYPGKPPLKNIKAELAGKKFLHGPIGKGECKVCHDPHGSDYFRMLRGNYPSTLYAPYSDGVYDACLNCHAKNLLSAPETITATGFRNGGRNLHYVHVSNSQKGRTCRLCHAPHASDGPKLINKGGSSFGDWKIPFKFEMTETGGSCAAACHRAFRYDRVKPEVYK